MLCQGRRVSGNNRTRREGKQRQNEQIGKTCPIMWHCTTKPDRTLAFESSGVMETLRQGQIRAPLQMAIVPRTQYQLRPAVVQHSIWVDSEVVLALRVMPTWHWPARVASKSGRPVTQAVEGGGVGEEAARACHQRPASGLGLSLSRRKMAGVGGATQTLAIQAAYPLECLFPRRRRCERLGHPHYCRRGPTTRAPLARRPQVQPGQSMQAPRLQNYHTIAVATPWQNTV